MIIYEHDSYRYLLRLRYLFKPRESTIHKFDRLNKPLYDKADNLCRMVEHVVYREWRE